MAEAVKRASSPNSSHFKRTHLSAQIDHLQLAEAESAATTGVLFVCESILPDQRQCYMLLRSEYIFLFFF